MTITRNFKLCLNAGTQNAPYINVNQYDEGEQWIFDLYTEGGQKFTPSTGAIIGIKSDGNAILNSGTVNSSGQVVITETEQMTAASGLAVFELLIEGETHGTANFIVNVERRPSDDAEFSDSDLSMLQEAIDAAEVINEILDEGGDPSEIIAENVDAWLDNHPEATTTVQDGAITAPKINNSLWDKILVNEEASGAVASFDDGADDVPVSSLKVNLEPVQLGSGDPSPTNVRPIIAANGKNLIGALQSDSQTSYGVTVTPNGDGTFTVNGTNTKGNTNDISIFTETISLPVDNYLFNGGAYGTNGTSNTLYLGIRDANNQVRYVGSNGTADTAFSIAEGDHISNVFIRFGANGTANNLVFKPMIRLASITDASYQPYQGIMVQRTGKNLLNSAFCANRTNMGITTVLNADGSITLTGTAEGSTRYWSATDTLALTLPIGTYTLSPSNLRIEKVGGGYSNGTFTLAEPTTYQNVYFTLTSGTTYNTTVYPQLEVGTEATEYEPYTGTSYPMSLGREVYGGSVDLATGVLTVTHAYASLNDSTKWEEISTSTVNYRYNASYSDRKKSSDSYAGVICSCVPIASGQPTYGRWLSSSSDYFGIRNTTGTITLDEVKALATANQIQICYELATPTTIQLTPQEVKTLLGYNNISSTGTVDVIYHADTKLYIDKRIAELG